MPRGDVRHASAQREALETRPSLQLCYCGGHLLRDLLMPTMRDGSATTRSPVLPLCAGGVVLSLEPFQSYQEAGKRLELE